MGSHCLRSDDAVDLQIHTVFSDGHWEPSELFAHLGQAGFRLVAITDHDTCERVEELRALGGRSGVAVLAGTELTTEWRGTSAHLLCYAPQGFGSQVPALASGTVRRQRENTRAVYQELLARGYEFPKLEAVLGGQSEPARPSDNQALLLAHGYLPDIEQAFAVITDAGYRQSTVPLADAVAAAHADGALAVIAHPGRGDGEIHRYDLDELSRLADEVPIDGIEVYYPKHTAEQVEAYKHFAARRGLLASAGSDSHGPRQRMPIGYHASLIRDLLDRCGVTVEPS